MKNLLFIIAVFSIALYSCRNDGGTENSIQDSTNSKVDSSTPGVVNDYVNQEAEEVSQDSIKQSATAKVEDDASFEKALPEPEKIFWNSDCGKYLKKLGFTGSSHPNDYWAEFGCKTGTYTLVMGSKKCKVFFDDRAESAIAKITITGDEKALDECYKKAKKLAYKGPDGEIHVEKKGKTVIISGGSAGF